MDDAQLAEALKKLNSAPLGQAVDFYLRRHPAQVAPRLVKDVVAELLAAKRGDRLSVRYVKQLDYDLARFATTFSGRIGHVTGQEIDGWLREMKVSLRTQNNFRRSVAALFTFAKAGSTCPRIMTNWTQWPW